MTKNLFTFSSPTPFPTSPDHVDGVNRSKFNFFFQNSINTNQQQRHLYRDNMHGSRIFFGGGGGRDSSTYFTVYRGAPMVLLLIFQAGGIQLFPGGVGGYNC